MTVLVDLSEIQAAYYMVAATGVLVAAFYYVMNLRITQKNQELTLKALEQSAKAQELQLKAQEQNLDTRQAQLFMQIYERSYNPDFPATGNNLRLNWKWADIPDFWKKYGPETNMQVWSQIASMGNYFKGLAVLYRKGLIDKSYIYEMLWIPLEIWWEKMGPIVLDYRNRTGRYNYFEFVDDLYYEMKSLEALRHPSIKANSQTTEANLNGGSI